MFSLPSLAPQDSYTLWYTSSTIPNPPALIDTTHPNDPFSTPQHPAHAPRRHHSSHRTPLARLRLDEEYAERRKHNIQNFGSSWLKPPGMPKSLHQLREEEREMKEHQEAMRREALAQELAEAEAEGADELLQGEGMDGMEEMEEVRDLDDEVPDADADATGLEADDEEDEDEEDGDDEENNGLEVPRGVLQAQVPQDVYREALARGQDIRAGQFADGASTIEDEEHSGILQEEDLVHEHGLHDEEDMGMGVDLDADVPDADEGYEHTDTEAELTSSDDESQDGGLPQHASIVRSDGAQNSLDLRSLISGPSSQRSQMGASSSPQLRRPPRS